MPFIHLLILIMLAAVAPHPARAQIAQAVQAQSAFNETLAMLPVRSGNATIRLETYSVRRKDLAGALPLAIITHGTDAEMKGNREMKAENFRLVARDLARRGWHAVAVVRQGFGRSEGTFPRAGDCGTTHRIDRVFDTYANNLLGVAEALSKDKQIDASRVLFLGASTGGLSSVVAASRFASGKAFAVNLSGGWRSTHCEWQGQVAGIFGKAGADSAAKGGVPTIFFYAENDSFFGPPIFEKFLDSYRRSGGNVRFVRYPAIGEDGHFLMGNWAGREKWLPDVDQFLAANGLPHLSTQAIRKAMDEAKVPRNVRDATERYLRLPGDKAIVIAGDNSRVFWNFGNSDAQDSQRRALENCGKVATGCRVLMMNNGPPE